MEIKLVPNSVRLGEKKRLAYFTTGYDLSSPLRAVLGPWPTPFIKEAQGSKSSEYFLIKNSLLGVLGGSVVQYPGSELT